MAQGDRLRIMADLLDRVIFPPRRELGKNIDRARVSVALGHKSKVIADGFCREKKAGRKCWMCSYKLKLRKKSAARA